MSGSEQAAGPQYVRTRDSDEWVRQSFRVQERYRRVLAVSGDGRAPDSVRIAPLDLNSRSPAAAPGAEYRVDRVFRTLQEAADASRGGDLIAVMPGAYAGIEMTERPDAGDGRYVHFKAMGRPGDVTIHGPADRGAGRHAVWLRGASYVIVQGFNIAGSTGPGLPPAGTTSGMLIGGAFSSSGKMTHHVALIESFSHNHRMWGMHSSDSHTVLMQDNCFGLSRVEHAAYISNGSDNYCVRRNVFFGSPRCGLHMNLDAYCSLQSILLHSPQMKDYPPYEPTREYVERLLADATERFGENNFPDGRGPNFIIEQNVVNGNGAEGGGSFNLAGVYDSLIQNNLVYGNRNHGIAHYNDSAPHVEREAIMAAAVSVEQAAAAPRAILFGSHSNLVRHNTVLMDVPDRFAMGLVNGAWGNRLRNNVFVNHRGASIEVSAASLSGLDSGYNVVNDVWYRAHYKPAPDSDWPDPPRLPAEFLALAHHRDEENHSTTGITLEAVAGEFEHYGLEPWVIVEGNWWRLNPDRPDFRPRHRSTLLAGRGDPTDVPPTDLGGAPRSAVPDIGAYRPSDAE